MRIKCYTLYDITQTNVNFRKKNTEIVPADEMKKRSQQSNFETILQSSDKLPRSFIPLLKTSA